MPEENSDPLAGRIITIRSQRVILDADLARLYGVPTKRFNEAVKRNVARFPKDFAFQLSVNEHAALRSQIATTSRQNADDENKSDVRSSAVSASHSTRRRIDNLPWAFTEHGAVMAANVLRSPKAVAMSVYVVRAFVRMREELMTSAVILRRLAEVDKKLVTHDVVLRNIYEKLRPLLTPPSPKPAKEMGFHANWRKP